MRPPASKTACGFFAATALSASSAASIRPRAALVHSSRSRARPSSVSKCADSWRVAAPWRTASHCSSVCGAVSFVPCSVMMVLTESQTASAAGSITHSMSCFRLRTGCRGGAGRGGDTLHPDSDNRVGAVAAGAVIKHSRDWNLARESTLGSGLHPTTPAYDLQRACGTSLSAIVQLGYRVALGEIDCAIGGGADSTSDIPLSYGKGLQKIVLASARGRSFLERIKPWGNFKLKDLKPMPPSVGEPRTGMSMGEHCHAMAKEWKISRREQDELALKSHLNAAAAWQAGFFKDLMGPFGNLSKDNNVRGDTALEKLSKFKPSFVTTGHGTPPPRNRPPPPHGPAGRLV